MIDRAYRRCTRNPCAFCATSVTASAPPATNRRCGERHRRWRHPSEPREYRNTRRPDDRDPRRPEPANQQRRQRTGDQSSGRERRDRNTIGGVRQPEVGLDLRIARQQVREQCAVGQKQRRDRDPGPTIPRRRWPCEPSGSHLPETTRRDSAKMATMTSHQSLADLAARYRVATEYDDANGRHVVVSRPHARRAFSGRSVSPRTPKKSASPRCASTTAPTGRARCHR